MLKSPKQATHCWALALGLAPWSASALPWQPPAKRTADLVEVTGLDPSIKLDIRYASSNNFLGRPVYAQARAYLQREAAIALVQAHKALRLHGFGIQIFDAYRPWSVTVEFWHGASPQARQAGYVAKPAEGSRHNRGCAVDVTLYELSSGKAVQMPSEYDEFSERAHPHYSGSNGESQQARERLIQAMKTVGFEVLYNEWWHFDFRGWRDYALMDVRFEQLALPLIEKSAQ
jgi:zinc D-Ala-D-Ala dipeptidase